MILNIKRNIYLMYAIACLQGMVFYGPVATLYRQAQGVSVFQITLIESISLFLCILLEAVWGVVADRVGYKKTMVFCCVFYFLSKIVFWRAAGFVGFLAERVMLSVVIAGLSGVDTSILYLSCEGEDSQKIFGIYNSLQTAGLLAAAAVFALFVKENYRLAGLLTVVSYGAAAVLSFGIAEVKSEDSCRMDAGRFWETLSGVLGDRRLLLFLLSVALLSETHQTVTVFLNQLQYERCGLDNTFIGYLYIAATLLGLCGVCSARITRRTGIRAAGLLFGGGAATACVILALSKSAVPSVGGIFALRIFNSLFQPYQTELQNRMVKTDCRATALSIHAMLTDSVAVGTNLVFGSLAERSLPLAFVFGAGICIVGTAFCFPAVRKSAKELL